MALSKFLDPKNDVAFRRIFGTEKNKDILIHFLNDILGFTALNTIEEVEFLSTIQDPEIASKKQSIVDVLCRDSTGVQYICEMQVAKTSGFEKRAQYYAAKAYSRQANQGESYPNLKEIVFIAIADCIIFPDKTGYKSDHVILDRDTYDHDLKDFYFTFIELLKFKKTKEDQLENIVEKWIYFFKYADKTNEGDLEKIIGSDLIIKRAYEELNRFNWSEKEFIAYEQEIKRIRDEQAVLAYKLDQATEKGRQQGIQIGQEKGIQIGQERGIQVGQERGIQIGQEKGIQIGQERGIQIGQERGIQIGQEKGIQIGQERGIQIGQEKGIQIGQEKGIQIGQERGIQIGQEKGILIGQEKGIQIGQERGKIEGKIEVAKAMLANDVDIDTIVKSTGLSLDEIEKLQKD